MENVKFVTLVLICLFLPTLVLAYEPNTAHKGLTSEIVKLYESFHPGTFSSEDIESLKKGTVEEDDTLTQRPFRHFYDPVYNRGLNIGAQYPSAKAWSQDPKSQSDSGIGADLNSKFSTYLGGRADYSWQRAIYEYVWGDRQRAMESLGHVLHLIQDMTVPDHTRDDPHPPFLDETFHQQSPYEAWTDRFNQDNLDISNGLIESDIVIRDSLDSYFDTLANFSNSNFFSKDTVFDPNYTLPNKNALQAETIDGINYLMYSMGSETYPVVSYVDTLLSKDLYKRDYLLNDDADLVMFSYWNILSKEAVKNGAGVIDLFFREVEKERETGELKAKNVNPFVKVMKSLWGVVTFWKSDNNQANIIESTNNTEVDEVIDSVEEVIKKVTDPKPEVDIENSEVGPLNKTENLIEIARQIQQAQALVRDLEKTLAQLKNNTPPTSPIAESNPESGGEVLGVNTINSPATPAGSNPLTTEDENPSEDDGGGDEVAEEDGGSGETEEEVEEVATTTPKALITLIDMIGCNLSLSGSDCWTMPGDVSVVVETDTDDFEYIQYEIVTGGETIVSTSTEKTFLLELAEEGEVAISVALVYADDTMSDGEAITIHAALTPIVISEIAWMGTEASANDEWIELYNRTSVDIDLSGWRLASNDGSTTTAATPEIELAGVIPAKGYFLLERTDDTTVGDVVANQVYVGVLGNGGEVLSLYFDDAQIDQTPLSDEWVEGDNSDKCTMERYDADVSGLDEDNWMTAYYELSSGLDADDNTMCGSPGARNTVNYLINKGEPIETDIVLRDGVSPYVFFGGLVIAPTGSLAVPAGTILKGYDNSATLVVYGDVVLNGTASNPVVLTSFADGGIDDSYGAALSGVDDEGGAIYMAGDNPSLTGGYVIIRPLYSGLTMSSGELAFDRIEYEDSQNSASIAVQSGMVDIGVLHYVPVGNGDNFMSMFGDVTVHIDSMDINADTANKNIFYTFNNSNLTIGEVVFRDFVDSNLIQSFNNSVISVGDIIGDSVSGYGLIDVFGQSEIDIESVNIQFVLDTFLISTYHDSISKIKNVSIGKVGSEYLFYIYHNSDVDIDGVDISEMGSGGVAFIFHNSLSHFKNVRASGGDYVGFFVIGSDTSGIPRVTISNSTLTDFADTAVQIYTGDMTITDSIITGSLIGVFVRNTESGEHTLNISGSTITDNFVAGVWNNLTKPATVTAINNDWGDTTGPYHETENPEGFGGTIIGDVLFDPWVGKE